MHRSAVQLLPNSAVRDLCAQFPNEYFRKVDSVVIGEARSDRHLSGMGTTLTLAYIVTIVCFILALRFLSHPARARYGNFIGAFGMAFDSIQNRRQPERLVGGSIGMPSPAMFVHSDHAAVDLLVR